jgi:hypothetical protein
MGHRPAAIPAALLAVRSLIGLLGDDRLDPASAQAGAARPRGVRLIGSYRVRSGARAADRSAHPDFLQHCDEPGAIGGLSGREHERQRATAPGCRRWTLLVSPPRERPSAAASSRARRRRRSRRRSARSDSPAGEPTATGAICPVSVAPFPAPRPLPAPPRPPVPTPSRPRRDGRGPPWRPEARAPLGEGLDVRGGSRVDRRAAGCSMASGRCLAGGGEGGEPSFGVVEDAHAVGDHPPRARVDGVGRCPERPDHPDLELQT